MDYTIERDKVAMTASYQEVEMIEAAGLLWQGAADLPGGVEFAKIEFGGVEFVVYRQAVRWPTVRNCNLSSRDDDRGRHVWEAVKAADRGCEDCDLIGSLDALEATLSRHAESDSAEAEAACTEAEEDVEAAILAVNAAFESVD